MLRFVSILFSLILVSNLAQAETTLSRIAETGVINIGHREASLPFSYLSPKKKPVGYTVDICRRIVKKLSEKVGRPIKINFVPVTSESRMFALISKNVDMVCGSSTDTPERRKMVSFMPSTYLTGTRFLVKTYGDINTSTDLNGKTIAVTSGTTTLKEIQSFSNTNGLKLEVKQVGDHAEGFVDLVLDRVDAYASDEVLLYSLKAKAMIPEDYKIIGDYLSEQPYAIMVRKDDENLRDFGALVIKEMARTGGLRKLHDFWFSRVRMKRSQALDKHLDKLVQ